MEIHAAVLFLFNYVYILINNKDAHLSLLNPEWKLWVENLLDQRKRKSIKATG